MRLPILLTAFFALGVSTLFAQQESPICKDEAALIAAEQYHQQQLLEFRTSPFTNNYDQHYLRLEWTVDPAVHFISGTVTSYFEPTEANFERIYFDLNNNMQVSQVLYHGQPVNYSQHDNLLDIVLPGVLPQGQSDSISITYAGAPSGTGFGSFVAAQHAGTPVLWTLSEPYGGRDWWPCKLDLNDKIDSIDVYVRTPAAYRAASNGLLVEEWQDGADKIYHWHHNYPITAYLVAIAVTNYAVYSDFVPVPGGDPIEVLNYVYPESQNQAQSATIATVQCMELFNELYGLYPFASEKYGHAQFSWGGGMEHQTMSFMGGWSFSLQAHELAHQWFGDKVTCGSWQDIWLNEGFATYSEGLTYYYGLGTNTWPNWLQSKRTQVMNQPDGSVWVPDTTSVNRIFSGRLSYSKGALVLHMLRWKVGHDNFFQAVQNYLEDDDIAYNYARTAQLQHHLEVQSGLDLDEFFEDWYYGQGHPTYILDWWNAGGDAHFNLMQSTSHPSVDFFEMPTPVLFKGQNQDSLVVFDHTFSGQSFTVDLPFVVTEVVFDPELWILAQSQVTQLVVGTQQPGIAGELRVGPNPAKETLNYAWSNPELALLGLELHDNNGLLLNKWVSPAVTGQIPLGSLAPGLYYLVLQTEQGAVKTKIVKQ